jgi:C1A family cysteine protease
MSLHTFNNKRDKPDSRDFLFEKHFKLKSFLLPKWIDLRRNSGCPDILHQETLGSCTACGSSNALRFILRKNGEKEFQPSRLFIYYFTRVIEDTVNEDTGGEIRNALKAIKRNGVCSEIDLPYDVNKFTNKPSEYLIESAKNNKDSFKYYSVRNKTRTIKNALCNGFPVIFGFELYSSFESEEVASTGIVPMPDIYKEDFLGGHCAVIYGYRDSSKTFICMNSWGKSWGEKGFFYLPYEYVSKHGYDLWTINQFVIKSESNSLNNNTTLIGWFNSFKNYFNLFY